jgi:tetratricopeptide (TPR) repeat protein
VKGINKLLIIIQLLLMALALTAPCVTYAKNVSRAKQTHTNLKSSKLTECHPERKDIWLEFANVYAASNEYRSALALMQEYQSRFGTTREYWRGLARILVAAGRYNTSMRINECLLAEETGKQSAYFDYLMATRILDLAAANCQCAAVKELGLLKLYDPYSSELIGTAKRVLTPLRSNITFYPDYYSDSVPVSVTRALIDLQYFLSPRTSLLFRELYKEFFAKVNSGFETIWGSPSIWNESFYAGFTHSDCFWNLQALVGILYIERVKTTHVCEIKSRFYPNETLRLDLELLCDVYRPFIYNVSPRAVSLGIKEMTGVILFNWQPVIATHMDGSIRRGHLSDGNCFWLVNLLPSRRAFTYDDVNVDFGLNIELLSFNRDFTVNGYFSPRYYGLYQVANKVTINPSENVSYDLYTAIGIESDTVNLGTRAELDVTAEAKFEIPRDWQLSFIVEASGQVGPNTVNTIYLKVLLKKRFEDCCAQKSITHHS